MIDFSEAELAKLAIHYVGNKLDEDGIVISEKEVDINGTIAPLLTTYFTKPFRSEEYHQFFHETNLDLNEVYTYAKSIFDDPSSLLLQSINVARHLYEQSIYPQIKQGELYVAYFENCLVDNLPVEVVGIFKSEQKQTFLKVYPEGKSFSVDRDDGIDINKLDKGCLVLNDQREDGFKVLLVDNTNKGDDAKFWKELFLNVKVVEDAYFQTKNYLQLCKDFSREAFPEADRIDQLAIEQESARFFREEEEFDKVRFQEKVLQEPEIIEAFESYKGNYQDQNNVEMFDEFEINPSAVKNMKRVFKSVIKLDKNFHIYVHGNRSYIRKGYDEESHMNFYQLYYKDES